VTRFLNSILIEGAIGGAAIAVVAFALSRFFRDSLGRSWLVILLFAATGAYLGFVVVAQGGFLWILIELAHIVAFGVMALRGLRGSPYWLAAAWGFHPIWDLGMHFIGPGRAFAPFTYTIACLSFDLIVAAYIILAYGLIGPRRLRFRETAFT
jgi:hypothetical protein